MHRRRSRPLRTLSQEVTWHLVVLETTTEKRILGDYLTSMHDLEYDGTWVSWVGLRVDGSTVLPWASLEVL